MTTEPDRLEALKPCPFGCEGAPILHRIPGAPKLWKVSCVNCDSGRSGRFSEAEAFTAWNARPVETNSRTGDAVGERANLIARIEYILDMTASAKERLHRRAHLTNHDLRMCIAALSAPQSITPPEGCPQTAISEKVATAEGLEGVGEARQPTHYCVNCAARWIEWPDGSWSTISPCGPCCDNVSMTEAPIVPILADGTVNGRDADAVKRRYRQKFKPDTPNLPRGASDERDEDEAPA